MASPRRGRGACADGSGVSKAGLEVASPLLAPARESEGSPNRGVRGIRGNCLWPVLDVGDTGEVTDA